MPGQICQESDTLAIGTHTMTLQPAEKAMSCKCTSAITTAGLRNASHTVSRGLDKVVLQKSKIWDQAVRLYARLL